jgi:cytochrome c553
MKKILVAAAIALFASQAMAAIALSSHDLSDANNVTNRYRGQGPQISSCQFCHAPHNSNTGMTGAPLWNRDDYVYGGTLYTSGTFVGPEVLGTASLVCLSCHDGSTDMGNTFTGSQGFSAGATPMNQNFQGGGVVAVGSAASNGISDDHPVGIAYPGAAGAVTGYRAGALAVADGARFYGATSQVECGTCHDPHGTSRQNGGSDGLAGNASFLRMDSGTICASCHTK